MRTASTMKMRVEQYQLLGEDPPGCRLELVDGEVAVSPSPNLDHSFAVGELFALLREYVRSHGGQVFMDVDTVFGAYDVRRPDIAYVAADREHLIGETTLDIVPDLCIEVLSPSNAADDRGPKSKLYAKSGVAFLWLIDPSARSFEVGTLKAGRFTWKPASSATHVIEPAPFRGLQIHLGALWRPKSAHLPRGSKRKR